MFLVYYGLPFSIHFKMLLITYKSIGDKAPEYLGELVSIRKSSRKFRSSSQILLQVPVSRLKSYSDFAFSLAAPTLWNRLPADIRNTSSLENFKSLLNSHLFKVAFTELLTSSKYQRMFLCSIKFQRHLTCSDDNNWGSYAHVYCDMVTDGGGWMAMSNI